MSVDKFLDRRYHRTDYNCLHFARDVWLSETGVDITEQLRAMFDPKTRNVRDLRHFRRIEKPQSPCLVLMQRPRIDAHVGVYIRGKVLHITDAGVSFVPLNVASRGFPVVRYYL